MTRDNAKALLPIIKAYSEGKIIQYRNKTFDIPVWTDVKICSFSEDASEYRIKLGPRYRPFNDAEECWNEMLKHQPFGWIKAIGFNHYENIYGIKDKVEMNNYNLSYEDALHYYTFADGTPFGIQEESES